MRLDKQLIQQSVRLALDEDVGSGDITAALIPCNQLSHAVVRTRESMVLCGQAWFEAVFLQLDSAIKTHWFYQEGDEVAADSILCELTGDADKLLTGERTALNFLQTLSGTATETAQWVQALQATQTRILDTRKTLPGLRAAQKYAVRCGGGMNHRQGLYDAFLIKENHIQACGSIEAAVALAKAHHPDKKIEVEVENCDELQQAIAAKPDSIMLDNFSSEAITTARKLKPEGISYELSGGIVLDQLAELDLTGIDFISIGALTKHVRAIDLSLSVTS